MPPDIKNVSLDKALLPDRDNPLLPTQNIPNAGLGGLTIIQQAPQSSPIPVNGVGTVVDIAAPTTGSFMLSEGTLVASPLLSFQLPYQSLGGGISIRSFYDRQVGNIRFINDTGGNCNITYQLYRIDGKVGSS
jgi:hypothetical protein